MAFDVTDEVREVYEGVSRRNAEAHAHQALRLRRRPRSAAVRHCARSSPLDVAASARWIWRCHIDTSTPDEASVRVPAPFIGRYDAPSTRCRSTSRRPRHARSRSCRRRSTRWRPRTWPWRSTRRATSCASSASTWSGRCCCRCRASTPGRIRWASIDAYRTVKVRRPEVQLGLIGSMASDDPEGWDYLDSIHDYAGGDPDVFILSNLDNVGGVEINAFQSYAVGGHPEEHARGLRAHGDRGPLEVPAGRRRRGRRHPDPDRGRRDAATWWTRAPSARSAVSRSSPPRVRPSRSPDAARSTCASTSSRRVCCATICACSPTCGQSRRRSTASRRTARPTQWQGVPSAQGDAKPRDPSLVVAANRGPVSFHATPRVSRSSRAAPAAS